VRRKKEGEKIHHRVHRGRSAEVTAKSGAKRTINAEVEESAEFAEKRKN
jgi:hypothetical protein